MGSEVLGLAAAGATRHRARRRQGRRGAERWRRDVVDFRGFFRPRLPSRQWKEGHGFEVSGRLQGEPNGVRAAKVVPLQTATEGAEMDLMEPSKSRQEVLRVRRCNGEPQFECSYPFSSAHLLVLSEID